MRLHCDGINILNFSHLSTALSSSLTMVFTLINSLEFENIVYLASPVYLIALDLIWGIFPEGIKQAPSQA